MGKDDLPEVSVPLAILDIFPVLFFFLATVVISKQLRRVNIGGSILLFIGGLISFVGGFLQVIWKLNIALYENDIEGLHKQLKFSLGGGYALIIIAIIISSSDIRWKKVFSKLLGIPCIIFIFIAIFCGLLMVIFVFALDSNKMSTHWIEESVNIAFQGNVFLCASFSQVNNKTEPENQESSKKKGKGKGKEKEKEQEVHEMC